MKKIILASASPRRQMLLSQAGIPYEVMVSDIDETMDEGSLPAEIVKALSLQKAMHVLPDIHEPAVIIAADTVVALESRVLGKPTNAEDAFRMLKSLQGRTHTVYTGVTLINQTESGYTSQSFVDYTLVSMRPLSDDEIQGYIRSGESFDKAGAYAIQGKGSLLIERVEGDYYTVVGLPLVKMALVLQEWGFDLFNEERFI